MQKRKEAQQKKRAHVKENARAQRNKELREARGAHRANVQRSVRQTRKRGARTLVKRAMCVVPSMKDLLGQALLEGDDVQAGPDQEYFAFLTKPCSKQQKMSTEGVQAMREEMAKVCKFRGIGKPTVTSDAMQEKDATVSSVHMLCSIKFMERE